MHGYKVCRPVHGSAIEFRPAASNALPSVRYALGKTTHRPTNAGPFAVFAHRADAVAFRDTLPDDPVILEVNYNPSKLQRLWCSHVGPIFTDYHELFLIDCPDGTCLATQVTPLRLSPDYAP